MNRIAAKFKDLKERGKKAFIAYLTVGFPDIETNLRLVLEMEKRGVDIIELGIPFSDPIADGPTIQASSQASLVRGDHTGGCSSLSGGDPQAFFHPPDPDGIPKSFSPPISQNPGKKVLPGRSRWGDHP